MRQIIVAHEKHGPRYIDLSDGVNATAKALLKERVLAGWYFGAECEC